LDATRGLGHEHPNRNLILHLIPSHHGNGRPHFKEQGYDRDTAINTCQEAALHTLQRFGHLQARYGWWGLAYLEALLKAADALVSAGHVQGDVS
jgi:CRISPR-associated endonuclease/helicase Cas3